MTTLKTSGQDHQGNASKPKLLHVGFPKSMSTSFQRGLFINHPEIMFLGWGVENTSHGWIDDSMASLCEVGIRYKKVFDYDHAKAKALVDRYMSIFQDDDSKKLLCLSYESFSFTMHYDVDVTIKTDRLRKLLGDNVKILMVIRNQLDLIRSYYYECVRGGYPGFFDEFLDYMFHYQFHTIISDLRYNKLYNHYCDVFGKENILVLPMEIAASDTNKAIDSICDFCEISYVNTELGTYNSSDDKKFLQAVRYLNEKFVHNRGHTQFGWIDDEKLRSYWSEELFLTEFPGADKNHSTQMMVYRCARDVVKDFVDDLPANYPPMWFERIASMYNKENTDLATATGLDLATLGYPYVIDVDSLCEELTNPQINEE